MQSMPLASGTETEAQKNEWHRAGPVLVQLGYFFCLLDLQRGNEVSNQLLGVRESSIRRRRIKEQGRQNISIGIILPLYGLLPCSRKLGRS